MKSKLLLILLAIITYSYSYSQSSEFIKVEGQKFSLSGTDYYPVVINYAIQFRENCSTGNFFITPRGNYAVGKNWGTPPTCMTPSEASKWGGIYFIGDKYNAAKQISDCKNKLVSDFQKMRENNFNTLRICDLSPSYPDGVIKIPTGSIATYLTLLNEVLDSLASYDLHAILLLNAPVDESLENDYISFLETISFALKDNTTLMGYDFFNEPTTYNGGQKKYTNSARVSNWHYAIKKNAPNHLTTVGYSYTIAGLLDWDPAMHPVDFASFHIYAWSGDVDYSKEVLARSLKWYSSTIEKAWIIGETGFSGTDGSGNSDSRVGTESEQFDFAEYTLQRALDCNCAGYSWWQYQADDTGEGHWGYNLGLYTAWPEEREKQVTSAFENFDPTNKNLSNCIKESGYYNLKGHTYLRNYGRVVDNNGSPIENAVIDRSGITFTDEDGYFRYYTPSTGNYYGLRITAPGYDVVTIASPSQNVGTITLTSSTYMNCWMKKNDNNSSNTLSGWTFRPKDKFYPGDFDGDGIDELLCVQTDGSYVTILDYNNESWHWLWSNYGNTSNGASIYYYKNNITVGDFDGDGKDEVLGVSGSHMKILGYNNGNFTSEWLRSSSQTGMWYYKDNMTAGDFNDDGKDEILGADMRTSTGWTTLFRFNNSSSDWSWLDTDGGNDIYGMRPYRDNLIAGDFDGDGKDEILGNDIDGNGWITMFHYAGGDWEWGDSEGGSSGMMPYRNNLIVGNFDSDPADEILGISTWATKFDFINNDWSWSWSTEYSAILGDWSVNVNDSFFFIKATANDPEYFMTISTNSSADYCKMYLKNPLDGTNTINSFTVPFTVFGSTINESNDWDVQYSDGADVAYKFTLTSATTIYATTAFSQTSIQKSKIEVFDNNRNSITYKYIGSNTSSNVLTTSLPAGEYYIVVDGYDEGNFELRVTNTISTLKSSNLEEIEFAETGKVNIEEVSSIEVYPNPAQHSFLINLPCDNQYDVELIDSKGQVMRSFNNISSIIKIDCSNISSGIYLLKVKSNDKIYEQKVVINK